MVLTPAEKQKSYRERQKKLREDAQDQSTGYLRRPFHKFMDQDTGFEENLDSAGIHISGSLKNEFQEFETEMDLDNIDIPGLDIRTSLGRATAMVGVLIDAARELSELINTYKLAEIDARIAEIEQADLSDPATKKQALADTVRLTDIRRRLTRDVRQVFRQIEVKGGKQTVPKSKTTPPKGDVVSQRSI